MLLCYYVTILIYYYITILSIFILYIKFNYYYTFYAKNNTMTITFVFSRVSSYYFIFL